MPAERYFNAKIFEVGEQVKLTDQEFHHLVHVMRTKIGEAVELVNGQGMLASAEIVSIAKREAVLHINTLERKPKPSFEMILAQAIPRVNRLDFILEKGTELGMTQLWLFPGERGERKDLSENQEERAKGITISAMKQCGSLWLPSVKMMPRLQKWEKCDYPAFYGGLEPHCDFLVKAWEKISPTKGVILLIGPESGFTEAELDQLKAIGALGVKLHSNTLRTDTAALAALSLAAYCQSA